MAITYIASTLKMDRNLIKFLNHSCLRDTAQTQYVCRVLLTQSVQLDQVSDVMIKQTLHDQGISFAQKVSTTSHIDPDLPTPLKAHDSMLSNDKEIWDCLYAKDYFSLHNDTRTWQHISKDKYNLLKPMVGHALPTIAIATVKHNKNGKPCHVLNGTLPVSCSLRATSVSGQSGQLQTGILSKLSAKGRKL
eukprot:6991028-Ditylum_brightwellii.AAC.1